jgi:hypothetical protein
VVHFLHRGVMDQVEPGQVKIVERGLNLGHDEGTGLIVCMDGIEGCIKGEGQGLYVERR